MYKLLGIRKISSQELLQNFVPVFDNSRKQELFEKAFEVHKNDKSQEIVINKICFDPKCEKNKLDYNQTNVILNDGFFEYDKDQNNDTRKIWWMNFADPNLFVFYYSSLFAQDEIQVFEHPLLASVRSYLLATKDRKVAPRTTNGSNATPFLIENVPLWQNVNTKPILSDGSYGNIYGNRFIRASEEEISAGISVCTENIRNNIMAIAAPVGSGKYSKGEIEQTFETLFCSFAAAKNLSQDKKCVIHGGNWGCGAFGGNREFMYFAQLFAACITGVDELVLHGVSNPAFANAQSLIDSAKTCTKYSDVVKLVLSQNFYWGESDGN